jgi:hypothetical protein
MRRAPVAILAVLTSGVLTSCSTVRPATGSMWGYAAESQAIRGLNMLMYTSDRPTCELVRVKDVKDPSAATFGFTVPRECRQVLIGAGSDHWVFSYHNSTAQMGATDREWCIKLREGVAPKSPGWVGNCEPVAVRFAP